MDNPVDEKNFDDPVGDTCWANRSVRLGKNLVSLLGLTNIVGEISASSITATG